MWPHVAAASMFHGTSGTWDDRYIFAPKAFRNLDGSLFRDPDGYAWIQYNGASVANENGISTNGPGDDRPGLYKTQDFVTFTNVTVSAPFLTWDNGTWTHNGTSWDGRVVQPGSLLWDAAGVTNSGTPQFICFYDGDSWASNAEYYSQGVATCPGPTPDGTWTKYSGNPTFNYETVTYSGDWLYDPFAGNWKFWFVNNNSLCAVYLATASSYTGPWTIQNSGNPVYTNSTTSATYSGGPSNIAQDETGAFHMIYEIYGTPTWEAILVSSPDGITWTEGVTAFQLDTGITWEQAAEYWTFPIWDPEYGEWRLLYSGTSVALSITGSSGGLANLAIGCSPYLSPATPEAGLGRYGQSPPNFLAAF